MSDIVYFSSRKVSSTRGGGIVTNSEELMLKMRDLIPLYEGFMTYGGMERGTISLDRDAEGDDVTSDMELLGLVFPRRVFTPSQTNFLLDRIQWLYENRDFVGGLRFVDEPAVLRFFMGRLDALSDWPKKLVAKFKADFGDSL